MAGECSSVAGGFLLEHARLSFLNSLKENRELFEVSAETQLLGTALPERDTLASRLCIVVWQSGISVGEISSEIIAAESLLSMVAQWAGPEDIILTDSAENYSGEKMQEKGANIKPDSSQPDIQQIARAHGLTIISELSTGILAGESVLCGIFPDNYRYRRLVDWLSLHDTHDRFLLFLDALPAKLQLPAPYRLYALSKKAGSNSVRALALPENPVSPDSLCKLIGMDTSAFVKEFNEYIRHWRPAMFVYVWITRLESLGIEFAWEELLDSVNLQLINRWRAQEEADSVTTALARSWHQLPGISGLLTFDSVNLGPVLEYESTGAILKDVLHAFDTKEPS